MKGETTTHEIVNSHGSQLSLLNKLTMVRSLRLGLPQKDIRWIVPVCLLVVFFVGIPSASAQFAVPCPQGFTQVKGICYNQTCLDEGTRICGGSGGADPCQTVSMLYQETTCYIDHVTNACGLTGACLANVASERPFGVFMMCRDQNPGLDLSVCYSATMCQNTHSDCLKTANIKSCMLNEAISYCPLMMIDLQEDLDDLASGTSCPGTPDCGPDAFIQVGDTSLNCASCPIETFAIADQFYSCMQCPSTLNGQPEYLYSNFLPCQAHATDQAAVCTPANGDPKTDCDPGQGNETNCLRNDCCWNSVNQTPGTPWCYHRLTTDECDPNPCLNGGTCRNLINTYECVCTPGWTGTNCNQSYECLCTDDLCRNGGACSISGSGLSPSCTCANGLMGEFCTYRACSPPTPPDNGYFLMEQNGDYPQGSVIEYACDPGYKPVSDTPRLICQTEPVVEFTGPPMDCLIYAWSGGLAHVRQFSGYTYTLTVKAVIRLLLIRNMDLEFQGRLTESSSQGDFDSGVSFWTALVFRSDGETIELNIEDGDIVFPQLQIATSTQMSRQGSRIVIKFAMNSNGRCGDIQIDIELVTSGPDASFFFYISLDDCYTNGGLLRGVFGTGPLDDRFVLLDDSYIEYTYAAANIDPFLESYRIQFAEDSWFDYQDGESFPELEGGDFIYMDPGVPTGSDPGCSNNPFCLYDIAAGATLEYASSNLGSTDGDNTIDCATDLSLQNGIIEYLRHKYLYNGNTYQFIVCDVGYVLSSSDTPICVNGQWSVATPTCEDTQLSFCPLGPLGPGVFYKECGYGEISPNECMGRGCCFSTSAPVFWCFSPIKFMCPKPVIQGNVELLQPPQDTYYGTDMVILGCSSGYELLSPSVRVCTSDSTWTGGDTTICSRICPPIYAPLNGIFEAGMQDIYTTDDQVTMKCAVDYIMTGAPVRQCQENGQWDGDDAVCTKNYCADNPCRNGGTCMNPVDGTNMADCSCTADYEGPTCELEVTACSSEPCQNDGECSLTNDGYECTCINGFLGDNCENDPCFSGPCINGGTCSYPPNDAGTLCSCPSTHGGLWCETAYGICAGPNPCGVGTCVTLAGSADFCRCPDTHFGEFCQYEHDACTRVASPCLNGGTCTPSATDTTSYNCTCPDEYRGHFCHIPVTACDSYPCENGGTCTPVGLDSFVCACIAEYEGDMCQDQVPACRSNPCVNGGTCVDGAGNTHTCDCSPWNEGIDCSIWVDLCTASSCNGRGACKHYVDDNQQLQTTCDCWLPFYGEDCTASIDYCAQNPCVSGTCQNDAENTGYVCDCWEGATGKDCSESTESSSGEELEIYEVVLIALGALVALILLISLIVCLCGGCVAGSKGARCCPAEEEEVVVQSVEYAPAVFDTGSDTPLATYDDLGIYRANPYSFSTAPFNYKFNGTHNHQVYQ